jgi:hypothetical protein
MDPRIRIRIRIHTKMSWIRNIGRSERKSEQTEKLENVQHGSTEQKTKIFKTTMCPLVRGNRKHFFNISGFHIRIRGKDCF